MEMVPPQGEAETAGRVVVVIARRLAAVAFFMKGHMALDWRRTESMVVVAYFGGWRIQVVADSTPKRANSDKNQIRIETGPI